MRDGVVGEEGGWAPESRSHTDWGRGWPAGSGIRLETQLCQPLAATLGDLIHIPKPGFPHLVSGQRWDPYTTHLCPQGHEGLRQQGH